VVCLIVLTTRVPASLTVYRPAEGRLQTQNMIRGIKDACFYGFFGSLVSEADFAIYNNVLRAIWPNFTEQWPDFTAQK